ncbi:peptide chain release factor 2 [Sneathiella chinensis]|uniref:Peptide chain release factor 2 n=3 Tax=Alphaproteobacteria TaxID=28211 RepID=A0ABQ5U579_9PROT|nr:peptide chain release factor 2 [Sneathiella chinensis]
MRERTSLENAINSYKRVAQDLEDTVELIELAEMEDDEDTLQEAEAALKDLHTEVERRRVESMLSGEVDANDCYVEIHAGAGGTESQDWAQILLRMYTRWAEQHGCKVKILEESPGEEAGLKSVTIEVNGENAYGWLKTESGVHRLVRISPFDSNARRHTSFTSVGVFPVIDDDIEIDIDEKDLRIDTYRASGAGGQHVNRTESAIRITHIPTNVVVQCQNDRSQHKNRAAAMKMLKSRLYELEMQKRDEAAAETRGQQTDIGWGHQIRSYVLHPYQMVKDLRTGVEKGNAQGVLDGDLDDYLAAALSQRIGEGNESEA